MPVRSSARLASLFALWGSASNWRKFRAVTLVIWYVYIKPAPREVVWFVIYGVELYVLTWLMKLLASAARY
jgi:hypothetical protein